MARATPAVEFLRLVPERRVSFETDAETGQAVLLKPRFASRLAQRLLTPHLARPYVRIHLDRLGTFVWSQCDGQRSLADIAAALAAAFPEETEAEKRVERFARQLVGTGLIALRRE